MDRKVIVCLTVLLSLANAWSVAPACARGFSSTARDPRIEKLLGEISTERLKSRIERLASFGTRHTLSDTLSETRGIGAARRWIKSEFDKISAANSGRLKVEFQSYVQEPARRVARAVEVVNVVATLPGRQAESVDRVYVVGGHYDSRALNVEDASIDAPGANDDASGTAAVIELAEVMARYEFDATLVFVAFAGEEQALLGSGHFARSSREANRQIAGMITNDIIGNTDGTGGRRDNRSVRVFSEGIPKLDSDLAKRLRQVAGENDSPSRQLARFIDDATALYLPAFDARLVFRTDRYLRGGDHLPFLEQGYPAVRFTEPSENFERQHQDLRSVDGVAYGDVADRVDFEYVAAVTRVNAAALASLALAPAAPPWATLETSRLENDTTVIWSAVTAPDLAGYEIVWRDTTAPFWERALFVGNVDRFSLRDLSKDVLHFGVRAVDREGHRSPVTFALPRP